MLRNAVCERLHGLDQENCSQINLIYYYLQEVNEKKIIYHRKYLHDLEESRRLRGRLGVTSARLTFEEGEPEDEVESSNFRFRVGVPPEAEADSPDLPSSSNAWISSAANWFTSFHMGTTILPPRKEAKTPRCRPLQFPELPRDVDVRDLAVAQEALLSQLDVGELFADGEGEHVHGRASGLGDNHFWLGRRLLPTEDDPRYPLITTSCLLS